MILPSAIFPPRDERKGTSPIAPAVLEGIRQASRATHVDFGFLMAQAAQESGFQVDAKAKASSATGLYQFIDSTWLDMVRQHGGQYGIGALAAQVTLDANGRPAVADPSIRAQILELRKDPQISAALAAEFAKSNKDEVERALGRPASRTDLYLAHFLGAGGATELLKTIREDGAAPAADILPAAAAANHSVFYDAKSGTPRTVSELYSSFAARIEQNSSDFQGASGLGSLRGTGDSTKTVGVARWLPGLSSLNLPGTPIGGVFNAMMLAAIKLLGGRGRNAG
jgi:hypothetical protein